MASSESNKSVTGPFGINFLLGDPVSAIAYLEERISESRPAVHVHLVNAYTIVLASRNEDLLHVLTNPRAVNLIDSFWLSRLLASASQLRVPQCPGPSLFSSFLKSSHQNVHHFLLGGDDATLGKITNRIGIESGVESPIVGIHAPKHQPLESMDVDVFSKLILSSRANLVWVGLGTPKQDFIANEVTGTTAVTTVCVGAAFDFFAGNVKEAPAWMRRIGMEWLFRLMSEPRRLWKRYIIGNFIFMMICISFLKGSRAHRRRT
jgi:N-acetylglucosaminyldiphosphoundecaprenol N-acetyl-beta-D-mannosaminyltransferase